MSWPLLVKKLIRTAASAAGSPVRGLGRLSFRGLDRGRPLGDLTHQEVRSLLAQAGAREAHNAHFVKRLVERGPLFGVRTMDDFARAFNAGTVLAGRHGTVIVELSPSGARAVLNRFGEFVTLTGRTGL
jgi:hypothetical protein